MHTRDNTLIAIILITSLVAIGGLLLFIKSIEVKKSVQQDEVSLPKIQVIEVPELTEEFEWTETKVDTSYYSTTQDNSTAIYEISSRETKDFYPTGKLYTTSFAYEDISQNGGELMKFYDSYLDNLEANGWVGHLPHNGVTLTSVQADGVLGQIVGQLKTTDDSMYVKSVVVGKNLSAIVSDVLAGGVKLSCPCKLTVTVFVSDQILLSDINKNAK